MSQTSLFADQEKVTRCNALRKRAEAIHQRADRLFDEDDLDRRGDLRVQACALESEADALVTYEKWGAL